MKIVVPILPCSTTSLLDIDAILMVLGRFHSITQKLLLISNGQDGAEAHDLIISLVHSL